MLFKFGEIAEVLKDELIDDHSLNMTLTVDNVSFDSRETTEKSLYIARKGEKNDGHNYIKSVLDKSKTNVALAEFIPETIDKQDYNRVITVKNSMKAFEKLAVYSRSRLKGAVIGITGSLGKTTTKDLLYHCLSGFGKASRNQQSFNNFTGVLTTLVNTPADTEFAIYEIGMSHKDEMDILVDLVKPNIAILNNVELAHSEFFNSGEEIADEKVKIFSRYANTAVLNSGNRYFDYCYNLTKKNSNIQTILTFNENNSSNATVNLINFKIQNLMAFAKYRIDNKEYSVESKNLDRNVFINLMPVLAVAKHLNLNLDKVCELAGDFDTTRGRNNIETTEYNHNGENIKLTIINGCYNAVNPKTFNSGFELMKLIGNKFNRKVCIFGGIHEAGKNSIEFNTSLLNPIMECKVDLLIMVGEVIKVLYDKVKETNVNFDYLYFENANLANEKIKDLLKNNDLVFMKGSKGTHIFDILNILTNDKMKVFV